VLTSFQEDAGVKRLLQISAVLIALIMPAQSQAQMAIKFRGSDGWGLGSRYEQMYNNFSLQSYYGTISKIDTVIPSNDMSYGICFSLKTSNEEFVVHLGPAWFVLHQDMNLSIGNKVEVRGAKVSINSKPTIMAAEVRYKDRVLILRDQDGYPYWCAWRKQ
jgi:hypothetical protein